MKRLVTGLLLASVLLVAGVVSASAVSIYQNPNIIISSTEDGSTMWLLIANNDDAVYNALSIALYTSANVDSAGSFVYKLNGTAVSLALTADDARGWDWVAVAGGRLIRCWLPTTVEQHEYVVIKLDAVEGAVKPFDAYFGNVQ